MIYSAQKNLFLLSMLFVYVSCFCVYSYLDGNRNWSRRCRRHPRCSVRYQTHLQILASSPYNILSCVYRNLMIFLWWRHQCSDRFGFSVKVNARRHFHKASKDDYVCFVQKGSASGQYATFRGQKCVSNYFHQVKNC